MFVGDVTVPNIEGEYILLFGIVFHEKNICSLDYPLKTPITELLKSASSGRV